MKSRLKILYAFIFLSFATLKGLGQKSDAILGKWISDNGNCIVDVFKQQNEYKAKTIWFHTKTQPMDECTDVKNPDPALRERKLLGLEVVDKLHYDSTNNEWVDGIIYDASTGKSWDSVVWLSGPDVLKVKGYWMFKFLSKTVTFKRYESDKQAKTNRTTRPSYTGYLQGTL